MINPKNRQGKGMLCWTFLWNGGNLYELY